MSRSWHRAIASLALVLFAFQSYVTQTHIHLLWQDVPNAFVQALAGATQLHTAPAKKGPADSPANCPICQDIALAGHFTSPAIIGVLPPALVAVVGEPLRALAAIVAVPSHDWQGRAPPRH